jgi:hypothetical protein
MDAPDADAPIGVTDGTPATGGDAPQDVADIDGGAELDAADVGDGGRRRQPVSARSATGEVARRSMGAPTYMCSLPRNLVGSLATISREPLAATVAPCGIA